jgi:hypothetical protein
MWSVSSVREGKVVSGQTFLERSAALEAVNVMKQGPRAEISVGVTQTLGGPDYAIKEAGGDQSTIKEATRDD